MQPLLKPLLRTTILVSASLLALGTAQAEETKDEARVTGEAKVEFGGTNSGPDRSNPKSGPWNVEGDRRAARARAQRKARERRMARAGRRNIPRRLIAGPYLPGPIARGGERGNVEPQPGPVGPLKDGPDLAYGAYQRGYYLTAMALALPRAEAGDPAAQTLLGELHIQGLGVRRDLAAARQWYRFAAETGDVKARFAYASLLMRSEEKSAEERAKDRAEAREHMKAAAEAGHSRAQFNFAQMLVAERPSYAGFARALPFYEAAAKAGIVDAQYALATLNAAGNGMVMPDETAARLWLQRAAAGGHDTAQVELGIWLVRGRGGPADPRTALDWFARAARGGNVAAQSRLARMYAFGIGTLIDPVKAGAWHVTARRAGYADPEMDRRFSNYTPIDRKRAIELANRWQRAKG